MTEETKNASGELEGSAFGRVLAGLMRVRGMPVDTETVEWLVDGAGLIPEDLMARMAGETSGNVGNLEGLRDALKLNKDEEIELALAYALELEDEGQASAPKCRMGSKTDNPCWRDAVLPRFIDEDEPRLCHEHAAVVEANDGMQDWYMNLQAIDEWIKGPVAETKDADLERLAYNMRDESRREYGALAVRAHAAGMVADRGPIEPGEASLSLEQEEELARFLGREEALNNVRSVLEDADEDDFKLRDKWAAVDVLALAAEETHEEATRFREGLGATE